MNIPDIEDILRQAPRPRPPAGLKERLNAQAPQVATRRAERTAAAPPRGWLARWWPALAPAAVSLACAAVFTAQRMEIQGLKEALQKSPLNPVTAQENASTPAAASADGAMAVNRASHEPEETARLKELVSQLSAEVSRLEQIQADNAKLRGELAKPPAGALTAEETQALGAAREKAFTIQCVNHLKQLGLAVRVWANDNGDASPAQLLEMTNEMSTPRILVCPADTGRQVASNWASFSAANCSYEYLASSVRDVGAEPARLLFRCPIHGNVALCDGSVQMEVGKNHPEWIVQREGKLYLQQTSGGDPAAELRKRYGLPPGEPSPATPGTPSGNAEPNE